LATYALLPVLKRFIEPYGITVESPDISLSARIIAQFNDVLTPEQRKADALTMLGEMTQGLEANIIKLPNISASIPQLNDAIAELQSKGYNIPNFPQNPQTDAEKDAAARYAKALGSAVNPVLREGNSDRRVAGPVKKHAQRTKPPVRMREWSAERCVCFVFCVLIFSFFFPVFPFSSFFFFLAARPMSLT
jgi:isocitrate dehydrogenase